MANFSEILIPSQMRPELAKHIAERLCWAPANAPVVHFTALALMFASWSAEAPLNLADIQGRVSDVFDKSDAAVSMMSNQSLYLGQAEKPEVGLLMAVHAKQAAAMWASRVKGANLEELRTHVGSTLLAAFADTSERTATLAENIEAAITALSPRREGALEEESEEVNDMLEMAGVPDIPPGASVMLVTPAGPIGPFKSKAEIAAFVSRSMGIPMRSGKHSSKGAAVSAETAAGALEETDASVDTMPGMAVYSQGDVISMLQRLPPPMPGEGNMQQRRVLETMANDKGWRKFSLVPEGDPLAELYETFPHFKPVLDFVKQSLALAGCGDEGHPVRVPPILVRGVPGTGKTFFAQELARVLGTSFEERDLSVASEAFILVGTDSTWKGSKPGIVLNTLVNGKTANPLICLNEVDKANGRGSHNSPIAALYTLLEPTSSNRFKDEFVPVELNASRVLWVLTANEGEIPEPILERTEDFRIPEPTQEQCRTIAISVWKNICKRDFPKGHGFAADLGEPLLNAVSAMRPRVMRKALTHAASMAALDGRKYLTLEDLATSQKRYDQVVSRGIGFSADIR